MKKQIANTADIQSLFDDARDLISATADVAGDKVADARKRLSAALDRGTEAWNTIQEKAVDSVKATDDIVRSHPYQSIGIAFGAGALVALLLARRD